MVDAAIAGAQVEIDLLVRRFRCLTAGCPRVTFAEQVAGLTSPHARYTPLAGRMIEAIGLALAGRAGARLAGRIGLPAGRNTLLRRVRALSDPQIGAVTVLGVDDFALRRGRVYGTVLIDLDSHRPVDLLPDREAATFAGWLAEHPGAQVICRDRAGAYAEGARTGAPDAVQVADRFHLWSNLAGYVETTVARHRSCLAQPPVTHEAADEPRADLDNAVAAARDASFEQRAFVRHARERYTAVQELKAAGVGIKPIAARLGLARGTVRKYYRAASVDDVLAKARDGRGSILRPWEPYLTERVNAGITNGSQLFQEIRDQGYTGSKAVVLTYLRPLRAGGSTAAPAPQPAPKVRTVTRWILTHPEHLDEQDTLALQQVLTRCQDLRKTAGHVTAFAQMLTGRHGDRLNGWIAAVDADDLPELHRFTRGLLRDHDAVLNGLTLPHSSGQVEGTVNRIKMIKRQMYGRANFDLLRKRVLLAT